MGILTIWSRLGIKIWRVGNKSKIVAEADPPSV
jgi:hypothetical protein